ncbi:MAG TPA: M3 family oligoendopeptidase [Candidatus Limnocylindria bacterium]|nr:M3 family oligoendopeptidase [Candidatus Limnocylindria bacterium]
MKFSEMEYKRPDFDKEYEEMTALLARVENAADEAEFFAAVAELDKRSRALMTQAVLCQIRHTIDTRDEFYTAEQDVMDESLPRFQEISTRLAAAVLASPFREAVAKKYGPHLLEKYEVRLKTFKPEIVPDLVEEAKLGSEYEKLMASAQIEFDGKTYNLSGLQPLMQSTDRDVRRRAAEAHWGWIAGQMEKLDALYDQLVKVRVRIAQKLGYENFIPVAYARMGRTDWDAADAKVYRDQIAESVVPLAQKLYREQAERIGIKDMKYYDYPLVFLSGNPLPVGGEETLVPQAQEMYRELSPQTDEFFRMMTDSGLMDLTNKPGKAPGGYMTFLADFKAPFIFSNFNGTEGDVDVLTHEAGHAFQGWLQRDAELLDLTDNTAEVGEIHSMSMEFFTHPWMERFFGPDTEKYYYSHVASSLQFLPYGASIDEFQEWVYTNPDAAPEQRRAKYREIEKKYMPHLSYEGVPYLEGGGRWQRQLHVYLMPFYYLDYTLSQVCAFQYFIWDMQDHDKAWASYLELCQKSGAVPFKKLVPESGLRSPFEPGAIAQITPELEKYLDGLDKSKIV